MKPTLIVCANIRGALGLQFSYTSFELVLRALAFVIYLAALLAV